MGAVEMGWKQVWEEIEGVGKRIRAGEVKSILDIEPSIVRGVEEYIRDNLNTWLEEKGVYVEYASIYDNRVEVTAVLDKVWWEGIEELCSEIGDYEVYDSETGELKELPEEELQRIFEGCVEEEVKRIEEDWGIPVEAEIKKNDYRILIWLGSSSDAVNLKLTLTLVMEKEGVGLEAVADPGRIVNELYEYILIGKGL